MDPACHHPNPCLWRKKASPKIDTYSKEIPLSSPKSVSASELKAQILHNPNKRVLFNKLPVFLWAYSLGSSFKHPELNDSIPWRKKLRNKLGEPPILIDTALAAVSAENIGNHLFNLGYFDNRVSYIVTFGKHKAEVDYIVEPGKPYRLNSFFREPADTALKPSSIP